jgi:hypothetical protein
LNNCKHDSVKHDTIEYGNIGLKKFIEIRHTGLQEKSIKPLIISTERVCFEVKRSDVAFLDPKKPLTPEIKESYLNAYYDFAITDTITYRSIINFVNENQNLFTNGINNNYGDYADYSIAINGKKYEIFYKSKDLFFLKLRVYLQINNGDKALIKKLKDY